jgi:hypothetical protein
MTSSPKQLIEWCIYQPPAFRPVFEQFSTHFRTALERISVIFSLVSHYLKPNLVVIVCITVDYVLSQDREITQ